MMICLLIAYGNLIHIYIVVAFVFFKLIQFSDISCQNIIIDLQTQIKHPYYVRQYVWLPGCLADVKP